MVNSRNDRVQISPLQRAEVDYSSPFMLSSKLRKFVVIKGYIAIFVCMMMKVVHIEHVTNLSTK